MDALRLRMFAGPNGSGKSTIKSVVPPELLGVYLNPDEMEKEIRERDFLDVSAYGVETTHEEILPFFVNSTLLGKTGLDEEAESLSFSDGKLDFFQVSVNAYFASVAADFIRHKLLEKRASFSFETVMSSPDKVALLEKAHSLGYRSYLYYIATEDPEINIARVKSRVYLGGHDVPVDKIVSRYARSLDLLLPAIRQSNRAYLFNNSRHGGEHLWVAEITDGRDLETKCSPVPSWFKRSVLDRIT
ncbi:MAG: zeta toxin family protein [Gloeobacteraceae cyanobacterium ES-bin-144]|nr:zeta toxin family protein [Verrucomicrobiales bacterium]